MLCIWGLWVFRDTRRDALHFGIGAVAAIALAFLLDSLLRQVLTPGVVGNGNFAYTAYGVVVGNQGWQRILLEYPELRDMARDEVSQRIYKLAFEALRAHPADALFGVLGTWGDFFSFKFPGAFSFINLVPLLSAFPAVLLFALSLLGIVFCVIARHQPSNSLSLALLSGIMLSVPMVPPRDADSMRAYAATIPVQALMVGVGIYAFVAVVTPREQRDADGAKDKPVAREATIVGLSLVVLSVLVPILLKLVIPTNASISDPTRYQDKCAAGQQPMALYMVSGTSLHIVNDSAKTSFVPDVRVSDFRKSIELTPGKGYPNALSILQKMDVGQTLMVMLDSTGTSTWHIVDTKMLPNSARSMVVCAHQILVPEPGDSVFYHIDSVEEVTY